MSKLWGLWTGDPVVFWFFFLKSGTVRTTQSSSFFSAVTYSFISYPWVILSTTVFRRTWVDVTSLKIEDRFCIMNVWFSYYAFNLDMQSICNINSFIAFISCYRILVKELLIMFTFKIDFKDCTRCSCMFNITLQNNASSMNILITKWKSWKEQIRSG